VAGFCEYCTPETTDRHTLRTANNFNETLNQPTTLNDTVPVNQSGQYTAPGNQLGGFSIFNSNGRG